MLRAVVTFFLVSICFVLQTSFLSFIPVLSTTPNLLIILTSAIGFMRGSKDGMLTGLFCGILVDVFFGDIPALNALFFMYIGYINGKLYRFFYPEDIKLPMIAIALSDIAYNLLIYFFVFLFRNRTNLLFYFTDIMLPELVITLLVMILLYFILLKLNKFLERFEKDDKLSELGIISEDKDTITERKG